MTTVEQVLRARRRDFDALCEAKGWTNTEAIENIMLEGNEFLHGPKVKSSMELRSLDAKYLTRGGFYCIADYLGCAFDLGLDRLRSKAGLRPVRTSCASCVHQARYMDVIKCSRNCKTGKLCENWVKWCTLHHEAALEPCADFEWVGEDE